MIPRMAAYHTKSLINKGINMLEKVAIFAVRMAGRVMGASPVLIAEQEFHALANLIKGHRLDVVFSRACVAFSRKS